MRLKQWVRGLFAPSPQRRAERAAQDAFRERYPAEQVGWTTLRADEPDRFVMGVFYGTTRPPRYKFFAVSKEEFTVQELEDDAAYRPKVWR